MSLSLVIPNSVDKTSSHLNPKTSCCAITCTNEKTRRAALIILTVLTVLFAAAAIGMGIFFAATPMTAIAIGVSLGAVSLVSLLAAVLLRCSKSSDHSQVSTPVSLFVSSMIESIKAKILSTSMKSASTISKVQIRIKATNVEPLVELLEIRSGMPSQSETWETFELLITDYMEKNGVTNIKIVLTQTQPTPFLSAPTWVQGACSTMKLSVTNEQLSKVGPFMWDKVAYKCVTPNYFDKICKNLFEQN